MISSISLSVANSGALVDVASLAAGVAMGALVLGTVGKLPCCTGELGAPHTDVGAGVITAAAGSITPPGWGRRGAPSAGNSSLFGRLALGAGVGGVGDGVDRWRLGAAVGTVPRLPGGPENKRMPLLDECGSFVGGTAIVETSTGVGVLVVTEFRENKLRMPLRKPAGLAVVVAGGCSVVTGICGRISTWATSAFAYDNCCKFCASVIFKIRRGKKLMKYFQCH